MTAIGHIYKIICTVDSKFCYIGSTFNRLSKRFEVHRSQFKRWLNDEIKGKCACYPYYEKYGIENCKIILIKSYEVCRTHVKDRRHLEAYEALWINRTKGCCNIIIPIQYLKKVFRREYRQANKTKIAAQQKEYDQANKVKEAERYQANKTK